MSMKNAKKWLAITSALCMVVPSMTAFASAAPNTLESTGEGAIEFDPKVVAPYYQVQLPTITDETYDFVLDPMMILPDYDAATYAKKKTAYFTKTATPASFSNPSADAATTDNKLYIASYTEVGKVDTTGATETAAKTALLAEFTGTSGNVTAAGANKYYVWVPDSANDLPNGKYELLTAANVENYCKATVDNTGAITAWDLNPNYKMGDYVFDGSLYQGGYTALGAAGTYDVLDYVKDDNGTLKTTAKKLYVSPDGSTNFTEITDTNLTDYVEVVDAVVEKDDNSDKIKIVNKSSADTTVKAKITVKNPEGLEFVRTIDADGKTSVKMDITGTYIDSADDSTKTIATSVEADAADATKVGAEVTVTLGGLSDYQKYNVYQGDLIPETGGHEYVRYDKTSMAYYEAELAIQVAANNDSDAEANWGKYVQDLRDGKYTKPEIEVVYELSNPVNAPTRVNAYDVQWDRSMNPPVMWFTATSTDRFTDSTKLSKISVKKNDASGDYTITTSATDLAKVTFAANGYAGITWDDLTDTFGLDGSATTAEIIFEYDDVEYVIAW